MQGNKKLGTLGILIIVVLSGVAQVRAITTEKVGSASVQVKYFSQHGAYNCGQASVQMVLYASQGIRVNQEKIKPEMGFIERAGTRNFNIVKPLKNRNATIVSSGILKTQAYLRECVDKSYYTIINIEFGQNSNSGHFVVVTGYNKTGFFLNDPWPEKWGEPAGREAGENAYVSSDVLQEIWWFRLNWALTIDGHNPVTSPTLQEALIWS
jgi:hypothetical protein